MRKRLGCEVLAERSLPSASYILTNEHADVQVDYDANQWAMFVRDKDFNVNYSAVSSLQYVPPSLAEQTRPGGAEFDFIGVPSGAAYYRLPQIQNSSLLYHGFGAESVTPGTFSSYDASLESHGRAVGTGRWIKLQLVAVDGPGIFSVWQNGPIGPIRLMSNYNDGIVNPEMDEIDYTDGISIDDAVWCFELSHLHMNFGFTQPGRYEVTMRPSARLDGITVTGPEFTFVYSVGNVGQLSFAVTNYTVDEAAGQATITVARTGGSDGAVQVDYMTDGGTATPDVDYTPANGTLIFDDLELEKSFTIAIVNDGVTETPETVGLVLSNFRPWNKPGGDPSDPPLIGTNTTATLTISDPVSVIPAVDNVMVNMGSVQRSRVDQIAVEFNSVVTLSPNAIQLRRLPDLAVVDVDVTTETNNGRTIATLTFPGALAQFGSLVDGRYRLTVSAAGVTGLGNSHPAADYVLDGDPNSAPRLFRLFGDADGNGIVSAADFNAFRLAYGGGSSFFDIDQDGQTSAADFNAFRLRYGVMV